MADTTNTPGRVMMDLKAELGTWQRVSDWCQRHHPEGTFYPSLVWKVANGRGRSYAVEEALVRAGLIAPQPKVVSVEACAGCGELHSFHATCPTKKKKDARKTRAWHGTEEEAQELDKRLRDLGFRNVQHWVDKALLDGEWFSFDE